MSDSYTSIEHDAARFAIEDAERDLLSILMRSGRALEVVTHDVGITAASMLDMRHRALFTLLVDVHTRTQDEVDFVTIAARTAELRAHGSPDPDLAVAGDLDGEFLYGLWSYTVPSRRDLTTICQFLTAAARERIRDETVEACIAALAHGSDPTQVLAHLRAAIEPTSNPGPDAASAVLSIPTTKEHQ